MGIGVSIFFLAVGAILTFAVEADVEGVSLEAIGVILMVVGGIGLLFSLLWASSMTPWGPREERTVVREDRI